MGKFATRPEDHVSFGRFSVHFFKRPRTLVVAEVRVSGTEKKFVNVHMLGDFKMFRTTAGGECEEVEYSLSEQNDGVRMGLRVRCAFLDKQPIKLHHLIYWAKKYRRNGGATKKRFDLWRKKLRSRNRTIDHDDERWWDFCSYNLVDRANSVNNRKATKARGWRKRPRPAR